MNEVSLTRLYVLRALYLLVVIGLGMTVMPDVIFPKKPMATWEFFRGVETCMIITFWLLCALGIRYPLQLLPILMWELIWKTIWLIAVPLPLWLNGTLDDKLLPNVFAIGAVVLVYVAMPWSYVYTHYVKNQGSKWRNAK
jgi:hypothetical protein